MAVTLIGLLGLLGWMFDIQQFKSILPGLSSMKANSAVCFLLAGIALWLLQQEPVEEPKRRLAQGLALIVGIVGLLTLAEYVLDWDLGIDQPLFRAEEGAIGETYPGRMSPITALNFLLMGGALLLLSLEQEPRALYAQYLTLVAAAFSIVVLLGYAYSVASFYQLVSQTSVSLLTAVNFAILAAGVLLARPERGLMALVTSEGAGGTLLRRVLPAMIGIPLVLGWLRLEGQRAGLYPTEFGTALLASSTVVVFACLIWVYARSLEAADIEQRRAREEINRLFDLSLDLQCIAGFDGYFKKLNPAWEKALGFTVAELTVKPYLEFIHPEDREATLAEADKQRAGQSVIYFENRYRCKEGSYRWLAWTAYPIEEAQLIYGAARDITESKRAEEEIRELNRTLEARAAESEALNKELEAFTYSVAHDLRAPLRRIDGFAQLLGEDHSTGLPEDAQHCLDRVREGTRQMGQLVDDLLNLARLGRKEVSLQVTGLGSLVQAVVTDLQRETKERAIQWKIQPLPFVECDPALLKVVFANLLSNAVKYTRPRSQAVIEVGTVEKNGQPVIFVRDNGVGFSMKYADKLFGVFQRLHRQEDFEGTGVGLATVQRIVHKHGGQVWAEGELDKGACFYFAFGTQPRSEPEVPSASGEETYAGKRS